MYESKEALQQALSEKCELVDPSTDNNFVKSVMDILTVAHIDDLQQSKIMPLIVLISQELKSRILASVADVLFDMQSELTKSKRPESKNVTPKESSAEQYEKGLTPRNIFTLEKTDETIHYICRIMDKARHSRKSVGDCAWICFYRDVDIVQCILKDHFTGNVVISDAGENVYYIEFPISVPDNESRPRFDEKSDFRAIQNLFDKYNVCYFTRYKIHGVLQVVRAAKPYANFQESESDKFSFYYRPDLHFSLRSSWEANVARVLNLLHIPFEYESLLLTRYSVENGASTEHRNGVYIPDFILSGNRIIEVKGFWNQDSRQKVLEFQKHFANYQYFIIDSDFYDALRAEYAEKIPEWEDYSHIRNGKATALSGSVEHIQIVGITYGNRKLTVQKLSVNQELVFERDKGNKFDKNAILVKTTSGEEVGFLSADWACIYAPKLDLGMKFSVKVESIEAKKVCAVAVRSNPEELILWNFLK